MSACKAFTLGPDPLTCAACGHDIEAHRYLNPLDERITEAAADRVVAFCTQLGLKREEVAATLFTVAINHMVATGVTLERVVLAASAAYQHRQRRGQNEKILVPV